MAFKVGSTTVVDDSANVVAAQLDINGATAETSFQGGDSVLVYDSSAGVIRKGTITNAALQGPTGRPGRMGQPDRPDRPGRPGLMEITDRTGQPDQQDQQANRTVRFSHCWHR